MAIDVQRTGVVWQHFYTRFVARTCVNNAGGFSVSGVSDPLEPSPSRWRDRVSRGGCGVYESPDGCSRLYVGSVAIGALLSKLPKQPNEYMQGRACEPGDARSVIAHDELGRPCTELDFEHRRFIKPQMLPQEWTGHAMHG